MKLIDSSLNLWLVEMLVTNSVLLGSYDVLSEVFNAHRYCFIYKEESKFNHFRGDERHQQACADEERGPQLYGQSI